MKEYFEEDHSLYTQVAKTAEIHGNKLAIIEDKKSYSYNDLLTRAANFSRRLTEKGVTQKSKIAVRMERNISYFVAILGISKLGAAFIPIDISLPIGRVRFILEDCQAELVVVNEIIENEEEGSTKKIEFDDSLIKGTDVEIEVMDSDLAYIIYTSGSTGKPKGVKIRNLGFKYLKELFDANFEISEQDNILQFASISFDASIWEISMTFFYGATLILWNTPDNSIFRFNNFINDNEISVMTVPPNYLMDVDPKKATKMKTVVTAGSEANLKLAKRWLSEGIQYINAYGPTETTVCACLWQANSLKELKGIKKVPIGRVQQKNIKVVNRVYDEVNIGEEGQLIVSGQGLSSGYLGRPQLNSEKFMVINDVRYYLTGDIVEVDQTGLIYFRGRADNQVKFNGYRIELEEIERAICNIASIKESAVKIEKKSLVAYYSLIEGENVQPEIIKASLQNSLPNYMVPYLLYEVPSFKLNTSGKLDKQVLNAHDSFASINYSDRSEQKLVQILEDILPVKIDNKDKSLMEYGLNSLGIINLSTRIQQEFDVNLGINEVLENSSLTAILQLIEMQKSSKNTEQDAMLKELIHDEKNEFKPFPLTNVQMAYLLGRNNFSKQGGYGTHGYFEIETELDVEKLGIALNGVIKNNEMLRAVFTENAEQKILPNPQHYKIETVNLRMADENSLNAEIEKRRAEMSHHVFDYTTWPLFDIRAIELSNKKSLLFISIDGLLADATSMKIFAKQWVDAYNGVDLYKNKPEITFRDYVLAEVENKKSEKYAEAKSFWLEKITTMSDAPKIRATNDEITNSLFHRKEFFFSKEKWENIKDYCNTLKITPTIFFMQVYIETLQKWSETSSFTLNLSVFNRQMLHADVEKLIGDFTTTTFVDTKNQNKISGFENKARLLQKELFSVLEHREFDGVEVIREYSKLHNKNLFIPYVLTSLLTNEDKPLASDYLGTLQYGISQTPQVYLDMQIANDTNGVLVNWDYVSEIFSDQLIERMIEVFKKIVADLLNRKYYPERTLPRKDRKKLLRYNNTKFKFTIKRLEELFIDAAEKYPDNVALKDKDIFMTYQEVKAAAMVRANQIQKALKGEIDKRIGIYDRRNCETIIDVLGILMSGNSYVPVDPAYPESRIEYIKEKAQISFMNEEIDFFATKDFAESSNLPLDCYKTMDDLAYIIFTSGSTGEPKGVEISHKAVVNTILDVNARFSVEPQDHFLLLSSLSFDLSVYDLFGALIIGASVYIIEDQRDISNVDAVLIKEQITIWNSVPSTMNALAKKGIEILKRPMLPSRIFDKYSELDTLMDEKITFILEESNQYKKESISRIPVDNTLRTIKLSNTTEVPEIIFNRRSVREFSNELVEFEDFEKLIASLGVFEDQEGAHFLYSSAGGLYPIDIYISVREGRVSQVEKGIYYYSPSQNELRKISAEPTSSKIHYYTNKDIDESSAFTIHLVYNTLANAKKYGGDGYFYGLIESGIVTEHLTIVGEAVNLGSCSIGKLEEEQLIRELRLEEQQIPIHSLIFGKKKKKFNKDVFLGRQAVHSAKYKQSKSQNTYHIRVVMLSGDYIPLNLPAYIKQKFGTVDVFSFGGATEGSIWSIYYPIDEVKEQWSTIPYGYPLSNQQIWIVNERLEFCPVGVIGEIVIAGAGVAAGYINDRAKSEASFIQHKCLGAVYRTGDYGVFTEDGAIEFKGRKDNQVKLNGYRIELPEVEKAVARLAVVEEVVVLMLTKSNTSANRLVAFVSLKKKEEQFEQLAKNALKERLPIYMIPNEWILLENIPVTSNGKLDRSKLEEIYKTNKNEYGLDPVKNNQLPLKDERAADLTETESYIIMLRKIFQNILNIEGFSDDDSIFNLGGDSISVVSIQKQIESELGVELKIMDVFENHTVNLLNNFLKKKNTKQVEMEKARIRLPKEYMKKRNQGIIHFEQKEKRIETGELIVSDEADFLKITAFINYFLMELSNRNYSVMVYSNKELKLLKVTKDILDFNKEELMSYSSKSFDTSKKMSWDEYESDLDSSDDVSVFVSSDREIVAYKQFDINLFVYQKAEHNYLAIAYNTKKLVEKNVEILLNNLVSVIENLSK